MPSASCHLPHSILPSMKCVPHGSPPFTDWTVFADEAVRAFLAREGYQLPQEQEQTGIMLTQLSRRLCCSAEFPHEIGVFLGYPLTDVVGFIENRGRNFTCCGCWKAYGDPNAARRHFAQLSKCTAVYLRLFHSGTPISRLAVAA